MWGKGDGENGEDGAIIENGSERFPKRQNGEIREQGNRESGKMEKAEAMGKLWEMRNIGKLGNGEIGKIDKIEK